jgi:hypothetical protein
MEMATAVAIVFVGGGAHRALRRNCDASVFLNAFHDQDTKET